MSAGARPWKVDYGYRSGRGITFDPAVHRSGIRNRSFATLDAAVEHAIASVLLDEDLCRFAAARVWGSCAWTDWPIGIVYEFEAVEGGGFRADRVDQLARIRKEIAE